MYRLTMISILTAALILSVMACVVGEPDRANAPIESQTNTVIDSDSTKEKALGLIFGMPQIDDRLDVDAGDREDWRYIIVPQPGQMTISINLDTPSTIQGGWNIYDVNGRTLLTESFNPNQSFYQLESFPVEKGIYFFKTYAASGKSIYTIGTSYSANRAAPVIEEYEEEEQVAEKPRSRRPRTGRTSKSTSSSGGGNTPPPAGAKTVKGFISIITPQNDGSAKITIRNAGTKFGVHTGDIGFIENGGLRIETTDCRATSCIAIIPERANPKALKENSNVIFTLK